MSNRGLRPGIPLFSAFSMGAACGFRRLFPSGAAMPPCRLRSAFTARVVRNALCLFFLAYGTRSRIIVASVHTPSLRTNRSFEVSAANRSDQGAYKGPWPDCGVLSDYLHPLHHMRFGTRSPRIFWMLEETFEQSRNSSDMHRSLQRNVTLVSKQRDSSLYMNVHTHAPRQPAEENA